VLVGLLVLASVSFAAALVPSAALAHAELLGTVPGADEVVQESPDTITLTFSEPVSVSLGGVRVYAPDGSRADDGEAEARSSRVSVPVRASARGTYAASWRVLSADGHAVSGAFVFHVGERGGSAAAV
jgi:copper transport protein